MKNILKTILIFSILILGSCSQEKKLFNAKLVDNGDKKSISYVPNMDFKIVNDSAFYYFNQEDYKKILGGDIKLGEDIYSSNNFKIKVILREYTTIDKTEYEMILRTYGNDFRIIDSFTISSTISNNYCDGYITNDLNVIRNCNGEKMVAGYINELGKFIIPQ